MPGSVPRIVVRDASGNEREVELVHTPFTLGRQSDNDLVLLDNRISRLHASILHDGHDYIIQDTGSRHGTFVNGERVTSCPLRSGDLIGLGVADACQIYFLSEQAALPRLLAEIGKARESPLPQLQHLGLLLKMAEMLNRAPALEEVLTALVDSAIQIADAERGLLFLRDDGGRLDLRLARGRGGVHLPPALSDYSREVVDRVVETGREEATLQEETTGRSANETGILRQGLRGVVAIPLQKLPMMEMGGETIIQAAPELLGVLYLDSRARATALTGLDRQVLMTLAIEGATVIENARMFRLTREQERMRHELALARNIQQSLLPRQLPRSDFFELRALSIPCQTVGGDYYDVVRLPGDRHGFTVADVSGKGLPAAMMAASLQGAFGAVAAGDPELPELFRRVNEFLVERTPPEMFATMFYGVLGPQGEFCFANGGHAPPLVLRARAEVRSLESSNFPLGLFAGVKFQAFQERLEAGDHVLIFSDGVTEAQDARHELFGESRLQSLLASCAGLSTQVLTDRVVAAIREFVGTAPQADDLTLLVLRYGPTA
ncbi:MAG: SpoIIE family protein phosphatase [Acidobacteriia bacterium]|nr:SpoIIE family protein phosphatase [Terriglobia bacterium]